MSINPRQADNNKKIKINQPELFIDKCSGCYFRNKVEEEKVEVTVSFILLNHHFHLERYVSCCVISVSLLESKHLGTL